MTLGDETLDEADPKVALDADGNGVLVWNRETADGWRIFGALWDADTRRWSGAVALLTGEARAPRVAMGPNGEGAVAWLQEGLSGTGTLTRHLYGVPLLGGFGKPEQVGRVEGSQGLALTVTTDGTTLLATVEQSLVVYARPAGGGWDAGTTIDVGNHQGLWDLAIAADTGGGAVLAFRQVDMNGQELLRAVDYAGGWASPQTIRPALTANFADTWLTVAAGAPGRAIAAWRDETSGGTIVGVERSGADWSAPEGLGEAPTGPATDAIPHTGVDRDGRGHVVWAASTGSLEGTIRHVVADGGFAPATDLPAGSIAAGARIALDPDGGGLLVYGGGELGFALQGRPVNGANAGAESQLGDYSYGAQDLPDVAARGGARLAAWLTSDPDSPLDHHVRARVLLP